MRTLANFINGEFVPPHAGGYIDNFEPATGTVASRVPDSDAADIDRAVAAAAAAFPRWSASPANQRSRLLLRLADLVEQRLDELALAESTDTGKPLDLARSVDIPRSAANLRFFATAILHTSSELHESSGSATPTPGATHPSSLNYTLRRPRGVAGLITPWNLPLYLLTWKLAPALATGNTAVCKPSEVTPETASILARLAVEAGLPGGVVNIVHGRGNTAGAALVVHPDVPTLSFTGSTPVGRWIAREAGERLKRVSLELGGKNPFIIYDDAALDGADGAIATAVRAAFTNQGQICLCGSRLLVQRSVYDRVLTEIIDRVRSLTTGDPSQSGTRQGALVSASHLEKVRSYVELARTLGGAVHCGGRSPARGELPDRCRAGYFFQPTVISGLPQDCRVVQEEIFGPVLTVQPFDSDDEAIELANGTPYGLAATIWTSSLRRAHHAAARVRAGVVWINCWMIRDLRTPFGGIGQSGVGREGGQEAVRFFTEPTNVCVAM